VATAPLLVKTTIPDVSGIAADAVTNSFVFAASHFIPIEIAVLNFWTHANTSASLGGWLGVSRSRVANACMIQTYELDGFLHGEPHGSPIHSAFWTLPAAFEANQLADQLCAVLSYHAILSAEPEHGPMATRPTTEAAQDQGAPALHSVKSRPRAGLRGRLYVGPLGLTANEGVTGDLRDLLIADLKQAAVRLVAEAAWSVWSRVLGTVTPIVGGWVDKEFGVQRRRTDKARTKLTWP